jgi:amino acid transporter
MNATGSELFSSIAYGRKRLGALFMGKPKDPLAPDVFQKVTLVPFLAWIGLGANGLSSSIYGPAGAFRALGDHTYLAVGLAAAMVFTVFIIAYSYSDIIQQFPSGGGGYAVATKMLGSRCGLISGAALLVDYVLTVSVSVAAAADASFSVLPQASEHWKLLLEFAAIGWFTVMNLRGVKESVTAMIPVFLLFIVTHTLLILGIIAVRGRDFAAVTDQMRSGFQSGISNLGWVGLASLFLHAYARGGGTYTGIEAVAGGVPIMREPRIRTARRTMLYMAVSLAVTAAGILICYLLVDARPINGQTMNAVLLERFAGDFRWAGIPLGRWFIIVTLLSEAALLRYAAQTGFIAAPRVMASMAADSWLPHSLGHLSERLAMQNGVAFMSGAAILTLLYTRGETRMLLVMYSINVFLTSSLAETGMVRYWFTNSRKYRKSLRRMLIHLIGMTLCCSILFVNVFENFREGGLITVAIMTAVIGLCVFIHHHYQETEKSLGYLDEMILELGLGDDSIRMPPRDTDAPTAVCFVNGFNGLGVQSVLAVPLLFGTHFENFVFVSFGVIDSSRFKGREEIHNLRRHTEEGVKKYVALMNRRGYCADCCCAIGTDPIDGLERLAHEVANRFPRVVFFAGKRIFKDEHFWHRLLHNQAAFNLERRLQFAGLQMVVLSAPTM